MLDESVAFDMLAILTVKVAKGLPAAEEYRSLCREITKAVGSELMADIWLSDELTALIDANDFVFDCVEKAKNNEITAKEVDAANHKRFLAKRALQSKFWPTSPLRETKTER